MIGDPQDGVDPPVVRVVEVGDEPVDGPDVVVPDDVGVAAPNHWDRVGRALLAAVADSMARTAIYLSPAACADPVTLLAVIAHELGHCDQIAAGGLAWCAAYGLVPEVRAGAEAPCYAQDCAVIHALRGDSPQALMDGALERLLSYGLGGDDTMELARGVLNVMRRTLEHGGELGGPSHDVLEALRERGVL